MTPEQEKLLKEAQELGRKMRERFSREEIAQHFGSMLGVSPPSPAIEAWTKQYLEDQKKTYSVEGDRVKKGDRLTNDMEVVAVENMPNGDQLVSVKNDWDEVIQWPATRLRREGLL